MRDDGYRSSRRWEDNRGYGSSRRRSRSASRERREWQAKLAARRRESSEESEPAPNKVDDTKGLTEEQLMEKLMGFGDFSSSKGKEHLSTDISGVSKRSRRRYRQYMNRKGGFNRPLSPVF